MTTLTSPLANRARLTKTDLDAFLKDLKAQPKDTAKAELNKLLQAGEARLPEGAAAKIRDQLQALTDGYDAAQSASKRPAPAAVNTGNIESYRSMDGVGVNNFLTLNLDGKAAPGSRVEIFNLSRAGQGRITYATADADGKFAIALNSNQQPFFHGDRIGVRVVGQNGAMSDMAVLTPRAVEVQCWQSGEKKSVDVTESRDKTAPFIQPNLIESQHQLATLKEKAQHLVLAGKAGATEPFARLEVVIDGEVQKTSAAADGSFFFDVKGVKPGQQVELRVIDESGMVSTRNYATPALKFDTAKLTAASQGVPYDRMKDGKPDDKGPFLRFAADGVVDPFTTVTVENFRTGEKLSATADANGRIDLEIAGVHAGDPLGFHAKDPAGNAAPTSLEGWVVPSAGQHNARLKELLCANSLLGPQVDELIGLLQQEPTSVHRDLVQGFLDGNAGQVIRNVADKAKLEKAFGSVFCGADDIRTQPQNPEPKEPIVIGAKVIKPRVMDSGSAAGRDPLEVTGKAEPFSTVEIRNASQPNAPVIGRVQADKNGDFSFLSTNESLFLHGDQLLVRATDGGRVSGKDALAHTCAYELQVWNATNRTELVELPMSTDTRNPFLDAAKIASERLPIAKNGDEQVFRIKGAPLSAEPGSVVRVTNARGENYEAKVNKDGSFELNVGKLTPGETLNVMSFDAAGRSVSRNYATPALRFDSSALLSSSQGVPFQRFKDGKPDERGPFLDFRADGAVDPFSFVTVTNNSTGKSVKVQADENGNIALGLAGVHAGDSLAFAVTDPAGNAAPGAIENYVVPGEPNVTEELRNIDCQHVFLAEHVDRLIELGKAQPTAAHRAVFEGIAGRADRFQDPAQLERLQEAIGKIWDKSNDVRVDASNPEPTTPIVINADIIKPRVMDAPPPRPPPSYRPPVYRDPLEVKGKAEPFSTVEIRNASQPNSPVIGRVQADKNGSFDFLSTNESLFLHGDQIIVRAVDQGGAGSKTAVHTTCAYDLQVWHNPPRTERVRLPNTTDTRNPFLDMAKVTQGRKPIAKDGKEQVYNVTGGPMSAEPNSIVRVTTSKNEVFEAVVKKDGSFSIDVGAHTPGETLSIATFDVNGRSVSRSQATPALKFDPQALVNTSEGVPYVRVSNTQQGEEKTGPFLRFGGPAMVDPFSILEVKNNSTGQTFKAQADKDGNLDLEISGVHAGDSLSLTVKDPAGNLAPQALPNYVVPAEPRLNARLNELTCMRTILAEQANEIVALLKKEPTAAHRGLVEEWLKGDHSTFQDVKDKKRIESALSSLFSGSNDVRSDATNPAPKDPIVIGARVIKPRVMDQGSAAGRDPLEVIGKAEPFSTVEIRNASQPNAPVIGRAQADANGDFKFLSTNESLFLHGDQLLVRTADQGGARSGSALTETCAYELQVWNATNRTELVRLPDTTDTRNPFLDRAKVKQTQTIASKDCPHTFTTLEGAALSAEPSSIVRVTTSSGKVCETKVNKDGTFKLEVSGYKPGETLTAQIFDVSGRVINQTFPTEALKFDPNKLVANVQGPPYQKLEDGEQVPGGPFLKLQASDVTFPGAVLKVTNHATGKVESFTADDKGGFDLELSGVHAHDLLTFQIEDAAGNLAPQNLRAWQAPAESSDVVDPVVKALTGQRPITDAHIEELVKALEKAPTPQHRNLVDRLLREHPDWFMGGCEKALKKAIERLYGGPPEIVPDATNPRPRMPIVLGSEIIKPRVMDSGSPPNDPLEVSGLAEPLSTIEIYNGSVPGRPLIGRVKTDENGRFSFTSTDESKFLHGDQIVVMSADAGAAKSDAVVSRATAFELRVWNTSGRREKVELGASHDTRDPFLQPNLLKTERAGGTSQSNDSFVIVGQPGSAETYGKVEVKIGEQSYSVEAGLDGSFKLPVPGLQLGQAVTVTVSDPNGRKKAVSFTPAIA